LKKNPNIEIVFIGDVPGKKGIFKRALISRSGLYKNPTNLMDYERLIINKNLYIKIW
jgi:hypothetical protein